MHNYSPNLNLGCIRSQNTEIGNTESVPEKYSDRETSPLDRCRNAFFSTLLLIEEGFPSFAMTTWENGEWSIFLGSEDLAKDVLLGRPHAVAEAARWKASPSRKGWLCEPYSPKQMAKWLMDVKLNFADYEKPNPEYKKWLNSFSAKLATEKDALPTISFSGDSLIAWIHHRNPDMTPNGKSIERYAVSPPLPRLFEEERRIITINGINDSNDSWRYNSDRLNPWSPDGGVSSGWAIKSTGISDEHIDDY